MPSGVLPSGVLPSGVLPGGGSGPAREPASEPPHSDAGPDPEPDVVDLPFSIEPGMGLELAGQFFATALRHEPHGSVALLARLTGGAGGPAPTVIELARLADDVPPPRLAADGADLLVAIEDTVGQARSRAARYRVRLARLPQANLAAPLEWHDGPHASRDESNAFDFAAAPRAAGAPPGGALFAWDDWLAGESHGRVYVQVLSGSGAASSVTAASAPDVDAEEPRVVERPGGYWLAWLVDAASAAGRTRIYDPGEAEAAAPGAGASTGAGAAVPVAAAPVPGKSSPNGARGIEVIALDAAGQPVGNVRRIRTENARVVGYDLTTNAAGNAWLVWRQDAPSAGAAGGRVLMTEVQSDGPHETQALREEDVGSGEPSWLAGAAGSQLPWLTFPDQRDRTLLLPVDYPRPLAEPLALALDLQGAAALAAAGGQVLFALPKGRALELFLAACKR
ncbi:MAG: hypothetical protein ABI895_05700 [Deltaproteobacteria bacterium]